MSSHRFGQKILSANDGITTSRMIEHDIQKQNELHGMQGMECRTHHGYTMHTFTTTNDAVNTIVNKNVAC